VVRQEAQGHGREQDQEPHRRLDPLDERAGVRLRQRRPRAAVGARTEDHTQFAAGAGTTRRCLSDDHPCIANDFVTIARDVTGGCVPDEPCFLGAEFPSGNEHRHRAGVAAHRNSL
jgi:hypothetical protein